MGRRFEPFVAQETGSRFSRIGFSFRKRSSNESYFIKNNKSNCNIIINGKKQDLCSKLNTNQKITSLNGKENITSLINDLYISLKPDCPKNYILPNNFENLIIRILSTNFNVMKNNENIIMNSLLEKVFKISRNNRETINRFQNLYDKLTKRRKNY